MLVVREHITTTLQRSSTVGFGTWLRVAMSEQHLAISIAAHVNPTRPFPSTINRSLTRTRPSAAATKCTSSTIRRSSTKHRAPATTPNIGYWLYLVHVALKFKLHGLSMANMYLNTSSIWELLQRSTGSELFFEVLFHVFATFSFCSTELIWALLLRRE